MSYSEYAGTFWPLFGNVVRHLRPHAAQEQRRCTGKGRSGMPVDALDVPVVPGSRHASFRGRLGANRSVPTGGSYLLIWWLLLASLVAPPGLQARICGARGDRPTERARPPQSQENARSGVLISSPFGDLLVARSRDHRRPNPRPPLPT